MILSDVLIFTFTPLYPFYHGAYGISALTDQQLAGIVMTVEQLAHARDVRRADPAAALEPRARGRLAAAT